MDEFVDKITHSMSNKERLYGRSNEKEQRVPQRETRGPQEATVFDARKVRGNQEKVVQTVRTHIAEQKTLVASGTFDSFRTRKGLAVFSAYEQSGFFQEVFKEAANDALIANSDDEFKRHVDGFAFSKIAYGYLSAHRNQGETVLSSKAALDIQKKTFPQAEVMNYTLGRTSLNGIYVPDGFIVNKDGLITGVVEYTLSANPKKLSKQYWSFRRIQEEQSELLDAAKSRFVLVVPNSFKNDMFHSNSDVECVKVPISREALANYNEVRYATYRLSEDSPTLSELRERKHEQVSRIRKDIKNGTKVTKADRLYLAKADIDGRTQDKHKSL